MDFLQVEGINAPLFDFVARAASKDKGDIGRGLFNRVHVELASTETPLWHNPGDLVMVACCGAAAHYCVVRESLAIATGLTIGEYRVVKTSPKLVQICKDSADSPQYPMWHKIIPQGNINQVYSYKAYNAKSEALNFTRELCNMSRFFGPGYDVSIEHLARLPYGTDWRVESRGTPEYIKAMHFLAKDGDGNYNRAAIMAPFRKEAL